MDVESNIGTIPVIGNEAMDLECNEMDVESDTGDMMDVEDEKILDMMELEPMEVQDNYIHGDRYLVTAQTSPEQAMQSSSDAMMKELNILTQTIPKRAKRPRSNAIVNVHPYRNRTALAKY